MNTAVQYLIILAALSAVTTGAGLLPDGPVHATVGGSVTFKPTNIEAKPPFDGVVWVFGSVTILKSDRFGDEIPPWYKGRVTYYSSTASLELRGLTVRDNGLYEVVILSGIGSERGTTTLIVYERVSNVEVLPESVNMVEGSGAVSLICSSSGSSLSYVWMKDDSEVKTSYRVQITDGGKNLTITSVMHQDEGLYSCRVTNPVSSGSSNVVNVSISSSSNGLSHGAISGMVIAGVLVLLGLGLGIGFYCKNRSPESRKKGCKGFLQCQWDYADE